VGRAATAENQRALRDDVSHGVVRSGDEAALAKFAIEPRHRLERPGARAGGNFRHLGNAVPVELAAVQKDLRDGARQLVLHAQGPHVDVRPLAWRAAHQGRLGVDRVEVATDREGLADRASVVEFEHGKLAERVERPEGWRGIRASHGIHLPALDDDALFGKKDANPARMHAGGEIVQDHGVNSLGWMPIDEEPAGAVTRVASTSRGSPAAHGAAISPAPPAGAKCPGHRG
jgi:hypothetical protein